MTSERGRPFFHTSGKPPWLRVRANFVSTFMENDQNVKKNKKIKKTPKSHTNISVFATRFSRRARKTGDCSKSNPLGSLWKALNKKRKSRLHRKINKKIKKKTKNTRDKKQLFKNVHTLYKIKQSKISTPLFSYCHQNPSNHFWSQVTF